jgi:hypothetical protein
MEIHTIFPNNFQLSGNIDDDTLYSKYKYLMKFTDLIGIEYTGQINKKVHLKPKEDKILNIYRSKLIEEIVNEDLDCDYSV